MANVLASNPTTRREIWKIFFGTDVSLHLRARWKRGGRTKARMVGARLPTTASRMPKSGIPTATPQAASTRKVRRMHTITVRRIL